MEHLTRIANTGQRVPALESRPVPSSHLYWIWEGYATLDSHRHWGQGFPQPILLSEILAYGRLNEWGREQLQEFVDWVDYLDGVFMRRMADRQKARK